MGCVHVKGWGELSMLGRGGGEEMEEAPKANPPSQGTPWVLILERKGHPILARLGV